MQFLFFCTHKIVDLSYFKNKYGQTVYHPFRSILLNMLLIQDS